MALGIWGSFQEMPDAFKAGCPCISIRQSGSCLQGALRWGPEGYMEMCKAFLGFYMTIWDLYRDYVGYSLNS